MSVRFEGFPCNASRYNNPNHKPNSSLEEHVEEKHNATVFEDNHDIVGSIEKIENKSSHNEIQYYNFIIQDPPLNIEADDNKMNINNLEDEITIEVYVNYVDDNKGNLIAEYSFTSNENKSLDLKKNDSSEESLEKNKNRKKTNMRDNEKIVAEWKSQLECDICCELIPTFKELKTHYKESHNTNGYVRCCGRKFKSLYLLVDHINLHSDPGKYKCDLCRKLFTTKANLKHHKKILHEKILVCSICSTSFTQNASLEKHMSHHIAENKNFKCNECGITYKEEGLLKNHIMEQSKICYRCGKTLCGIRALHRHLMVDHASDEKYKKLMCEECDTVLNTESSLQRHKATYHNPVSTVFICNICGKVSVTEFSLRRHKKYVHETEKKYKCPDCGKAFRSPNRLRHHMNIHTGETKYKCTFCPQYYTRRSSCNRHLKYNHPTEWESRRRSSLHKRKIASERETNNTSETMYKCTLCSRCYIRPSSYNRHLKNNHPTEWESRRSSLHKRKIDSERVTSLVVM